MLQGDDKKDRERALARFEELVQTPQLHLEVIPGSGTPLMAHLVVKQNRRKKVDVATVLLAEGLVHQVRL